MFGMVMYVALLGAVTAMTLRKPHLALVAILCMFGLEQWGQIYIGFLRENSVFTNLYILLLVGYATFVSFKRGYFEFQYNHERNRIRFLCTALFAYAAFSTMWAPDDYPYSMLWTPATPYLLAGIVLAPLLIGRIEHLYEVHQMFIFFAGILLVLLAVVPEWGARALVVEGTEELVQLPLALAQLSGYLLIVAGVHMKRTALSIGWTAGLGVAALMVAILSASRGPIIFSLACLILIAPLAWPQISMKQMVYLIAGSAVLVLVAVFVFTQLEAFTSRWQLETMFGDFLERLDYAGEVLDPWSQSYTTILFGLGNSASFSPSILGIYPHIVPLEVLAEEGLIGFSLFLMFVVYSLYTGLRIRELKHLPLTVRSAFVANFGCMIFTMLLSLKQGSLISSPDMFLFAVLNEKYFFLVNRENLRYQKLSGMRQWLQTRTRSQVFAQPVSTA